MTQKDGTTVTYTGTTGTSSGTVTIHRGNTEASILDRTKIELLKVTINQLNNNGEYVQKNE